MDPITINSEKCTNCALCSTICPARVFNNSSDSGVATVNPEMQAMCSKCGHCEAYCPGEAINVSFPDEQQYTGPAKAEVITPEQIKYHMSNRRSVRNFRKTPVDKTVLQELMEIVRYAPSGVNAQNVSWIIVHDAAELKRLLGIAISWGRTRLEQAPDNPQLAFLRLIVSAWENGVDIICRNAPNLAVAYAPTGVLTSSTDCIIATTYLELAAPTYGVGTCWAGFFLNIASSSKELRDELGIPEGYSVYGALMLGYPEHKPQRIPKRKAAKVRWM